MSADVPQPTLRQAGTTPAASRAASRPPLFPPAGTDPATDPWAEWFTGLESWRRTTQLFARLLPALAVALPVYIAVRQVLFDNRGADAGRVAGLATAWLSGWAICATVYHVQAVLRLSRLPASGAERAALWRAGAAIVGGLVLIPTVTIVAGAVMAAGRKNEPPAWLLLMQASMPWVLAVLHGVGTSGMLGSLRRVWTADGHAEGDLPFGAVRVLLRLQIAAAPAGVAVVTLFPLTPTIPWSILAAAAVMVPAGLVLARLLKTVLQWRGRVAPTQSAGSPAFRVRAGDGQETESITRKGTDS